MDIRVFIPLLQEGDRGTSVLIALVVLVVVVALLYALLRMVGRGEREANALADEEFRAQQRAASGANAGVDQVPVADPVDQPFADTTPAISDDLTIIEGIGPKIASVLAAAGVTTFHQLAAMTPLEIENILQQANLRLANTGSWPEQARLAETGEMEALRQLQDRLNAGR